MGDSSTEEKQQEFGAKLGKMVASGYAAIGVGLAFDLGIFDVMSKFKEPRTSLEIAEAASLKERYVRELLGSLVQAHVVNLDDSGEKYILPPHHRQFLVHGSTDNGSALFAAGIPAILENYKDVKECFMKDGPRGVSYGKYGLFMPWMGQISGVWVDHQLIETYIPNNPEIRTILESESSVLDLSCGTGKAAMRIAKNFSKATVYGADLASHVIKCAQESANELQLTNCHFEVHDAANLPRAWTGKFDMVLMYDAVHDQGYPETVLQQVRRVLKPDGIFSAIEPKAHSSVKENLSIPSTLFLYIISMMVCLPGAAYFEGSPALGAAWGQERAVELFQANGFDVCSVSQNHGGTGNHFLCKKKPEQK